MQKITIANPQFEYDPEDMDGFKCGMFRVGKTLGAKQTGTSVYQIPPGQALCPYHYEYGEEEWLLVLEGRPSVRHPGGTDQLDQWDLVFFTTGPEGAHRIQNDTDETVRVMMYSTVRIRPPRCIPTATRSASGRATRTTT